MATRRKPGEPKERQVRVPNKKAATMPERESPDTKIGEPRTKITTLEKIADCQVAGFDWTRLIAPESGATRSVGDDFAVRNWGIFVGLL